MSLSFLRGVRVWVAAAMLVPATAVLSGENWPEWRGPARTGASTETGLPEQWSPDGQNLAWRVPIGGRSAPVVFGDHLYLQTSVGAGETLQERLICFNADTGQQLWEHRYNLFTSDAPPHRIAWSSPAVDPVHRQRLRDQRRRAADVALARRQAPVGAVARRGVRHVDHARRPHVVAGRRRRPGDRQRAHLHVGQRGKRRAPLPRVRYGRTAGRATSARRRAGRPTPSTPTPTSRP